LKIGLRHDIDTSYGLRWGLQKITSIEKIHDVRSTFFIRIDIIKSKKDITTLKKLLKEGWEIGLHLINTDGRPNLKSPQEELDILKKYIETPIHGVTYCGSTIGWRGQTTWRVMDHLNLKYMQGYGTPETQTTTPVIPTHLSLDINYVQNFGEEKGYSKFREDLLRDLELNQCATVLTHPEWFVRTVGSHGLMKIPLTLLRKQMLNKTYDRFLHDFNEQVEFLRYIEFLATTDICEYSDKSHNMTKPDTEGET